MNRTVIATTARFATTALLLAASLMYVSRSFGQDATPAAALSNQPANELGKLEFQLRSNPPESRSFGQASGAYWKLIGDTKDFPRAYSFFAELNDAAPAPQPTLLASKASATGTYISWLYQNSLQEQAGDATMQKLLDDSIAEYKQALAIDPENFAALYGYAVFEGCRPGGEIHQKELLAKLDTMRTAKPYLPWSLVDHLEKTGRPE